MTKLVCDHCYVVLTIRGDKAYSLPLPEERHIGICSMCQKQLIVFNIEYTPERKQNA